MLRQVNIPPRYSSEFLGFPVRHPKNGGVAMNWNDFWKSEAQLAFEQNNVPVPIERLQSNCFAASEKVFKPCVEKKIMLWG